MASFPPRVNEKEIGEEWDDGRGVPVSPREFRRGRDSPEEALSLRTWSEPEPSLRAQREEAAL